MLRNWKEAVYFGSKPPTLASEKGHPVILLLLGALVSGLQSRDPGPGESHADLWTQGCRRLIGPTKYYGYVSLRRGRNTRRRKALYIDKVRHCNTTRPWAICPRRWSNKNFANYGASTVPTLVLIDKNGIVRQYHPGNLTEQEITSQLDAMLK